jgi:hypothetical protein
VRIERLLVLVQTSRVALDPDEPPARRHSSFVRRHSSLCVIVEKAQR